MRSKTIDKRQKVAYNIVTGRDTLYTRVTELTFKCYVRTPVMGEPPVGGFFIIVIIAGNMGRFHSESGKTRRRCRI